MSSYVRWQEMLEQAINRVERAIVIHENALMRNLEQHFPVITPDVVKHLQTAAKKTNVRSNFVDDYQKLQERKKAALANCQKWESIFNGAASIMTSEDLAKKITSEYNHIHAERNKSRELARKIDTVIRYNKYAEKNNKITISEGNLKALTVLQPLRYVLSKNYRQAYHIYKDAEKIIQPSGKTVLQALYETQKVEQVVPHDFSSALHVSRLMDIFHRANSDYRDSKQKASHQQGIRNPLLKSIMECCATSEFAWELTKTAPPFQSDPHAAFAFYCIAEGYSAFQKVHEFLSVDIEAAILTSQEIGSVLQYLELVAKSDRHLELNYDLSVPIFNISNSTARMSSVVYAAEEMLRIMSLQQNEHGELDTKKIEKGQIMQSLSMSWFVREGSCNRTHLLQTLEDEDRHAKKSAKSGKQDSWAGMKKPVYDNAPVYGGYYESGPKHIFQPERTLYKSLRELQAILDYYLENHALPGSEHGANIRGNF